jgi:hypothetical protein
LPFFHK